MNESNLSKFLLAPRFPGTSMDYCRLSQSDSATISVASSGHTVSIANGTLYQNGPMHLLLTPQGQWLDDLSHFQPNGATNNKFPVSVNLSGNIAIFASFWSGGLYHWLYNTLPRMTIMRDCGVLGDVDQFLIDIYRIPSIAAISELMTLLNLPAERLVRLPAGKPAVVRGDRLIASNLPIRPSRFSCDCIVELAGHLVEPSQKKQRIFIGRRDAPFRNIVNYDSVFQPLKKMGFVEVELSALSYAQQINHFAAAEQIVAVHGAGLCHLPFCQSGTTVIELFPSNYRPDMYQKISEICNLNYRSVIGSHVFNKVDVRASFFDLEIDPWHVLQALQSAAAQ